MPKKVESLRIIGGEFRSRRIYYPNDLSVRPTKDKVREALFSSLGDIEGKTFLDLFAGSGSCGLEAVSRGATSTLVDNNAECISCINDNRKLLGVNERSSVIGLSAEEAIKVLNSKEVQFDYIYMDPPYSDTDYQKVLSWIYLYHVLKEDGILIVESDHPLTETETINFTVTKRKNFGFINLTYLKES